MPTYIHIYVNSMAKICVFACILICIYICTWNTTSNWSARHLYSSVKIDLTVYNRTTCSTII